MWKQQTRRGWGDRWWERWLGWREECGSHVSSNLYVSGDHRKDLPYKYHQFVEATRFLFLIVRQWHRISYDIISRSSVQSLRRRASYDWYYWPETIWCMTDATPFPRLSVESGSIRKPWRVYTLRIYRRNYYNTTHEPNLSSYSYWRRREDSKPVAILFFS